MNCKHLFAFQWRWRKSERWKCTLCGFTTRHYDSVDNMAMRPVHEYMSVAVRGFNTVRKAS